MDNLLLLVALLAVFLVPLLIVGFVVRKLSKKYPLTITRIRKNLNQYRQLFLLVVIGWALILGMGSFAIVKLLSVFPHSIEIAIGTVFGIAALFLSTIFFEIASVALIVVVILSLAVGLLVNLFNRLTGDS